jgi:isovaleryl-CoA dehydrogenase
MGDEDDLDESMYQRPSTDHICSAKLYEIGAGTSEIRRMVIGRAFNKEYAQA